MELVNSKKISCNYSSLPETLQPLHLQSLEKYNFITNVISTLSFCQSNFIPKHQDKSPVMVKMNTHYKSKMIMLIERIDSWMSHCTI